MAGGGSWHHVCGRAENCQAGLARVILAKLQSIIGRVAQLGERGVRNAEVEGSNPFASTMRQAIYCLHFRAEVPFFTSSSSLALPMDILDINASIPHAMH